MKKLGILFASVFLLGLVFQSCNNGKTYAEMKEEEREAIKRFIEREDINVISFEQFQEQDSTTNVDENQFVLFSETGVYMQIVEEGNGERLKDGRYEILARYVEEQITSDGIDSLSWNTDYGNSQMVYPDAMMLTKSGKSFSPYIFPSSQIIARRSTSGSTTKATSQPPLAINPIMSPRFFSKGSGLC